MSELEQVAVMTVDREQEREAVYAHLISCLDSEAGKPLYRQLAEAIERMIEIGMLSKGEPLASERRLTELLGVSRRTVRAALANLIERGYVSSTHGLGNYVQEPPVRRTLKLICPEVFAPDYGGRRAMHYEWIHAVEDRVNAYVHYLYAPTIDKFRQIVTSPTEGCDGMVVFCPKQDRIDELYALSEDSMKRNGFPIMVVNRDMSGAPVHFVSVDHKDMGKKATQKLLAAGHRRIAHVGAALSVNYTRQIHEGYLAAMEEAGLPTYPEDILLVNLDGGEDMEAGIREFLADRQFSAVVVSGIVLMEPFERACQRSGILIPSELSVVGVLQQHSLQILTMRWSAYVYSIEEVTRLAMEGLAELSRNLQAEPIRELLPARYEKGATVAPFVAN